MELQLFIYKNVALHLYYSKESFKNGRINSENVFIYFPGLPQMINKEFFVDKVNKNNIFFSVYYLGSWLSGGDFTYENCKETIKLAIEFIKRKRGKTTFSNEKIEWDFKKIYVIGYSFSGNPIISTEIAKSDVKKVILFAPLFFLHKKDVSKYLKDKKAVANFYDFSLFYLNFLRRGYKFAFRGIEKKSWSRYFSGKESSSFIKIDKNYPDIIIFHGKLDEKIKYESSLFFQKKKNNQAKIILIDNVGHDFKKLFRMGKNNKLI